MAETQAVEQAGALSQEKQTYRTYVKYGTDEETKKTILTEVKSKVESDKKAKNAAGEDVAVSWLNCEKAGFELFAENEFIRYTVKSEEGFRTLVPEEAQRVYIIQCGLNYVQNAKANAAMTSTKENTAEPEPLYSQETIDLREAINEPPTRRSTSDVDKLIKLLTAMGVPPEKQAAALAALMATTEASEATETEASEA